MRRGWRTGSPERLRSFASASQWEPSHMFGLPSLSSSTTTSSSNEGRAAAPLPQPTFTSSTSSSSSNGCKLAAGAAAGTPTRLESELGGFAVPEWCEPPRPPVAPRLGVMQGGTGHTTSMALRGERAWLGEGELLEVTSLGARRCILLGRSPDADVVLDHPSASRKHAALLFHRSGAAYLADLGSAHGTFVEGERLPPHTPTPWRDGERVMFGASPREFVLLLHPHSKPRPPRLRAGPAPVSSAPLPYLSNGASEAPAALPERACSQVAAVPSEYGAASPPPPLAPPPPFPAAPAQQHLPKLVGYDDDEDEDEDEGESDSAARRVFSPAPASAGLASWSTSVSSAGAAQLHPQEDALIPGKGCTRGSGEAVPCAAASLAPQRSSQARELRHSVRETAALVMAPLGEDDAGWAKLVDANTVRNLQAPPVLPAAGAARPFTARQQGRRRRVRFDTGPPSVRFFEVPSPERLPDPEAADVAPPIESTEPSVAGGDTPTSQRATPARPTCQVTVTTVRRSCASGALDVSGEGQFSDLVSSSEFVPLAKRRKAEGAEGAVMGTGGGAAAVRARLRQMYGEEAPAASQAKGGDSALLRGVIGGLAPDAAMAEGDAQPDALPPMGEMANLSSSSRSVDVLEWESGRLSLVSGGRGVATIAWRGTDTCPLAGSGSWRPAGPARDEHGPGAGARTPLPWRRLPPTASRAPLAISLINEQVHPLFVYVALERGDDGSPPGLHALSAWEELPPDEQPVALSAARADFGVNCLLLAPFEGLPCCEEEGAERAPFGESNTFRFDAASGHGAALGAAAALRLELAYQDAGGAPERPFCVLRAPLVYKEGAREPLAAR